MPVMWPAIKYEVLHNFKLQPGQDPDFYLYAMDGARDRLHEHREVITDQCIYRRQDPERPPG